MRTDKAHLLVLLTSACASISFGAVAQQAPPGWTPENRAGLQAAGVKYGITMVRAIAVSTDTALPPATGATSDVQRQALANTVQGYVKFRNEAQGAYMAAKASTDFLIDGAAVSMAASGVGVVPAAVLKATAQAASDAYFENVQKEMSTDLALYLKKIQPKLEEATGSKYEDLEKLSPEELKGKIDVQSGAFTELTNMVGADGVAKEAVQELVIQGIRNTQKATLDQISSHDQRLGEIDGKLGKLMIFQQKTINTLEAHGKALENLQGQIGDLEQTVSSIDKRLATQERNSGFVVDFVFDKMDPAAKAASLKAGFMAERFECNANAPNCDGPELKADLIKRFEAEAKIQSTAQTIQKTMSTLNDIGTIANNLGIKMPPELAQAMQYGNVASSAFQAFATGNYLGAIVQVSGVFGSRTDPDEERFKALMGYLKQQFEIINQKLEVIIQNQQKIMEGIVKLSEQMQSYYLALEDHLARMEFEINRIGNTARELLWAPWKPCYVIYEHVVASEERYRVLANGDFSSLSDMYSALLPNTFQVNECIQVGQTPITITAANWFGNLLDINSAVKSTPDPLPTSEAQQGRVHTKTALEEFRDNIHNPSASLLSDLLHRAELSPARGFELLMSPGMSVSEQRGRLAAKSNGSACGTQSYLQRRARRLLCGGSGDADQNATGLIWTPMTADIALVLTDWLMVASRLADLIDPQTKNYIPQDKLLDYAASSPDALGVGQDIVEKLQLVLDAAVGGYNTVYGDLTARAIADVLYGPIPGDPALADKKEKLARSALLLLKANPYLASNVAMIRLHDRYHQQDPSSAGKKPSIFKYRTAYEFALNTTGDQSFLLRGVFGDDLRFVVDGAKGKIWLEMSGTPDKKDWVTAPIAEPQMFVEGRFIYPPKMTALLNARQRVAERLADYQVARFLSQDEQIALVESVARAEKMDQVRATK